MADSYGRHTSQTTHSTYAQNETTKPAAHSSSCSSERVAPATQPMPAVGETGSFERISANQGAVVADRANAKEVAETTRARRHKAQLKSSRKLSQAARKNVSRHEASFQTNKKLFIGLGVAAALIALTLIVIGARAIRSLRAPETVVEESTLTQSTGIGAVEAQEEGIVYDGYRYLIQQDASGYTFSRVSADGGEPLQIFALAGEPVSVVLFDGSFVIAENLDNRWDVLAYGIGDGSVASALVGPDGQPVTGEGKLVSAELDGSELVLTDEAGAVVRVPLS